MVMEHELTRSQYRWVAIGAAVIAATGFARTYYLRFLFDTPLLPPLVQIHGAIMTLWCAGFILQTWFIEVRQIRLHQRLGIGMVALAATVVLLGEILTVNGVAREGRLHQIGKFHIC
jgi:hypothetical protein